MSRHPSGTGIAQRVIATNNISTKRWLRTNRPSSLTATLYFVALLMLPLVTNGNCDEKTHYLSINGFCCQLCSAGSKKVRDCKYPDSGTFCTSCLLGEDYTDEPNSSKQCKKCTICNVYYEDIVMKCTVINDTMCRCKEPFQRANPSGPCMERKENEGNAGTLWGIAVSVLGFFSLVVALGLYGRRHGWFLYGNLPRDVWEAVPMTDVEDNDKISDFIGRMIAQGREGNWNDVERELPELREWIGKTPSLFLHELKKKNLVTEEAYWRAFTIPDAAKRTDSILLPVMRRGDGKRRELLEILEEQRSRERHFLDMLKTSHVCSPSLNPKSAHRQLQISADLSTVTWTQEDQPYSDHAERFDQWEIVLCFENFSSGDHYWEVDVRASKHCGIGVTRGSIPRNCQEKSGWLGCNEPSWAFYIWDFNFKAAHDKQRKTITDVQLLERVGVRLDFNAGKLSFYNANTMELLHSFDDIPSEPLFPAMQVNSGSVAIREVQPFTRDENTLTFQESREDIQIYNHFANSGVHRTKKADAEKGDSDDTLLRTRTDEPSVVREFIDMIPAMLHHELLVQGLITQSELSEVYSMPRASARADFIIRRLDSQQEESPQLQEILREHREKQEAFLKMRNESSTCSPTLNPNTAHRNLQISADFKTVRNSTHIPPYPDHSLRFEHYQLVICSEKFSSGRHYWEVDVRGSEKFNIGVTYDAIPRKGDDKACKMGFNEVSWTLKKWCNTYTAVHNETETKLSVRDAPKRVGVHLDWEAGVLSFYSADSMSLLHRFHGQFDRELYPAMAVLCESLSICPLPYTDTRR